MNWGRIAKYVLLVQGVTFAIGFLFGVLSALAGPGPKPALPWYIAGSNLVTIFLLFMRLGRLEHPNPWPTVSMTWLGISITSVYNLALGFPLILYLNGLVVGGIAASAGAAVGHWRGTSTRNYSVQDSQPPAHDRANP